MASESVPAVGLAEPVGTGVLEPSKSYGAHVEGPEWRCGRAGEGGGAAI